MSGDENVTPGETSAEPWSAGDRWPEGWYPDPWGPGRQRRWTGTAWTAETRGGDGPWIAALGSGPPLTTAPWPAPLATEPEAAPPRSNSRRLVVIVATLVVIGLIFGFTVASFADNPARTSSASPPATTPPALGFAPPPTSSTTPAAIDPSVEILPQLVVRQADVPATDSVATLTGGDSVAGAPTLDLCNGLYPSDALRTAWLQVDMANAAGDPVFSTEAVLYRNTAATTQAFAELRSVVAQCPSTPVVSPVGEPAVTTTFNAAPDGAWPHVAGVERQAYDFNATDALGDSTHSVAVYLRRGRALIGLYFSAPTGTQDAVAGATTVPSIVNGFERRLAAVPATRITP